MVRDFPRAKRSVDQMSEEILLLTDKRQGR